MSKTNTREEIKEILLSLDLGYKWLMSDYASSKAKEDEYEKEGLEQVDEKTDQILALIEKEKKEAYARGQQDLEDGRPVGMPYIKTYDPRWDPTNPRSLEKEE